MAYVTPPAAMASNSPSLKGLAPSSATQIPPSNTQRSQRQLGLFAAGATFFLLSTAITRRSIVRRYKATIPKFYQPSNRANNNVNGAMEALEALNIATINVVSAGMMLAGGALWAFDIATIDDMRRKVRTNLGVNGLRTDQDAEEEIEEWFAEVLKRKEFKALRTDSILKELEEKKHKKEQKSTQQEK
jgi:hypothetical protein